MCSADTVTLTLIDVDDFDIHFYLLIVPILKSLNSVIFFLFHKHLIQYIFCLLSLNEGVYEVKIIIFH